MYTKDLVRRVTIRLDDELATAVTECSSMVGVSPSEWVRMVLHSYVRMMAKTAEAVQDGMKPLINDKTSTVKAVGNAHKKNH